MTEPASVLRFYFDYISHNAYIAWTQLPKLEQRYGLTIEPVPVLFAGLLNAHHQRGPAEVRPKAMWMGRNVLRKAAILGVPLNPPQHHPYNPLLSLRVSSLDMSAADRRRLIDAIFAAVWVESQHVAEERVVERVAERAGFNGPDLVAQTDDPAIKSRLRAQTDAAIAAGVFGVPTMIVNSELFFGYDDFPYMEMVLSGKDPLDTETLERWRRARITPSAVRPQIGERKP
jgi:2-hydroxychromene-2-carboxylate isomerase